MEAIPTSAAAMAERHRKLAERALNPEPQEYDQPPFHQRAAIATAHATLALVYQQRAQYSGHGAQGQYDARTGDKLAGHGAQGQYE